MPSRKPADAIALLKEDHRKVEELFETFERARGDERKADLVRQICLELEIHTIIEEEIFYPACKGKIKDTDLLDEGYVEHDGAKVLIAELLDAPSSDEFYDAKVSVLSEMIKHHVKEEEQRDGMFAQAKRNGADLVALGQSMAARKQELTAAFKRSGLPAPETKVMKGAELRHGELAEA